MIKRSIYPEDIIILNIFAPTNRTSEFIEQKLIKLKADKNNPQVWLETSILSVIYKYKYMIYDIYSFTYM